jgi:RNA polymerase sigma factor (sigma-70 family)
MNSQAEDQEVDHAYVHFRGLFFHAVGKLAAQGFVIPPDEVLDVVHDFFLEEWSGLRERFEANKSQFSTYVYAAFVRFARRRSIALQRFRNSLRDSKEIARLIDESEHVDTDPARKHDIAVVTNALAKLPSLQKELLLRYLDSLETSERALAAEYSLSRYKVRALLVEAFGATAGALGALKTASKSDWEVGVAIWQEGRSIEDAAAALGISPMEARAAHNRNRQAIAECVTALHQSRKSNARSTL